MTEPTYQINKITIEAEQRRLRIEWNDVHVSRFHFVWLRHSEAYSDTLLTSEIDDFLNLPDDPRKLEIISTQIKGSELVINWNSGLKDTTYSIRWLRDNCYSESARKTRQHKPSLWDGTSGLALPRFDWARIDGGDEDYLFELFLAVRDNGFARVFNVATHEGSVAEVASRFGPVLTSHLGKVFDVKIQPGFNIGATQSHYLGAHSDDNWRYAPIGISFFHCLKAHPSGGGDSILLDGFLAAERLRKNNPEAFTVLTTTPVLFRSFRNEGEKYHARRKMINIDFDGNIIGTRFTERSLAPQDIPEELIEQTYLAVQAFADEIYNPDLEFRYLMKPGDMNVLDNHRMLHGRGVFDPSAGERHLQHCSVPRDEFHNRLRIEAGKRNLPDEFYLMAEGALA